MHTNETAEPLLSYGSERLLSRAEVVDRVGKTFATIWHWMQEGKFPRSRTNTPGGAPQWLESEIVAWMHGLPLKPYKVDGPELAPVRPGVVVSADNRRGKPSKRKSENAPARKSGTDA